MANSSLARFRGMAIRDGMIVLVALLVWAWMAGYSGDASMRADLTGVIAGALVGICGYLLHEWGHLLGALVTGGRVEAPTSLKSGFLFSFDSVHNSRRSFVVMSLSGFFATALVVWAFYSFLPDGLLASRVARGVALFNATLTIVLEVPLLIYGVVGPGLPPVENGIHRAAARARAGSAAPS